MPTASNESQGKAGKKLHPIGYELMIHPYMVYPDLT